jgi:GxxExxY protein
MEPGTDLDELARRVIGAAIEVHRELGPGYTESVYEDALAIELSRREIPCARQLPIDVFYKGEKVGVGRLDVLVAGQLVVELKAVERLLPIHKAQLLSYLKGTQRRLGLLINFNVELVRDGIRRVVLSP